MLSGPFIPRSWMGACDTFEEADWVLVGLPYDGTTSFRPGTRFGPEAIRNASWGLETYSPIQHAELSQVRYFDAGELEFPQGNRDEILAIIRQNARETLSAGKRWLGLGGEHLVTFPAIEAYVEKYPDLAVLHFDAHADLRDDYLGEKLSHATVLRRVTELIGPERLVQIGIRSGPREEFEWMRQNGTLLEKPEDLARGLQRLQGRPVFLTIDLDVLDPSILCGTGTPEPGGMSFSTFMDWLLPFAGLNFVGADVVELSPHYDASGVSNVVAAKVVREVLLLGTPESRI
ncbi:agmatinase [Vampirovibrio chlorellavorus]|uniref:agmatinase n=1 Tax=Vampirovibrio chlorellavorus TaxID=758823 RepID=UPI0026F16A9A|nr:agmatinase [Vampirovibrio chlorellavorus]